MLRGWAEITSYLRLSRQQIERYRKNEGAPIMRLGRHVVMIPETFGTWLCSREKFQVARREARKAVTTAR
jgi:hypothetical protein